MEGAGARRLARRARRRRRRATPALPTSATERTVEAIVALGDLDPTTSRCSWSGAGSSATATSTRRRRCSRWQPAGDAPDGHLRYRATFVCEQAGRVGVTVRVVPSNPLLATPVELGRVAWALAVRRRVGPRDGTTRVPAADVGRRRPPGRVGSRPGRDAVGPGPGDRGRAGVRRRSVRRARRVTCLGTDDGRRRGGRVGHGAMRLTTCGRSTSSGRSRSTVPTLGEVEYEVRRADWLRHHGGQSP